MRGDICIPRLYAAASLKPVRRVRASGDIAGIPRLYAAASLKLAQAYIRVLVRDAYSAALCRGLIEALQLNRIPIVYHLVFRGSMPRPH